MACYQHFARVYDRFMADTPYSAWAAYIDRFIKKNLRVKKGEKPIVLDLACGTGSMTLLMARKGYDMIGADCSPDMLSEARDKAAQKKLRILYLAQDMRALDLYGTVDAALCVCDGLNYLLSENELSKVLTQVSFFMNPGGVFIFDMNTEYKFKEVLGEGTFSESLGDASYLWKNHYDPRTKINEYALTVMIHGAGREERFMETHHQRAYPAETVAALLQGAGFESVQINDAYTNAPAQADSERISFAAVKGFKTKA